MIWAVVLAAGASTRMGQPKALLRAADGRSFLSRIVDAACAGGTKGVAVVIGPPHASVIAAALDAQMMHSHHEIVRAHNELPERGMLTSVQAGLRSLPPDASAALVWPVDIPFVQAATVRRLLEVEPGKIVVPVYGGRGGHPLRLPRALFAEVMAGDPEQGLRGILARRPGETERLVVADPGVLVDVDTPEEYEKTRGS
jgi:molybdenum cofactor cytidylyltransferase